MYHDGAFSVQECTQANITEIYHNYSINKRCFADLPVLVNNTLLFLKPEEDELFRNSTEIPCKNIANDNNQKLSPDVQSRTQTTGKYESISFLTNVTPKLDIDIEKLRAKFIQNILVTTPKTSFKQEYELERNPLQNFLNFGRKFKNATRKFFNATKQVIWKPEVFENSFDKVKDSLKNITYHVKDKIESLIKKQQDKIKDLYSSSRGTIRNLSSTVENKLDMFNTKQQNKIKDFYSTSLKPTLDTIYYYAKVSLIYFWNLYWDTLYIYI